MQNLFAASNMLEGIDTAVRASVRIIQKKNGFFLSDKDKAEFKLTIARYVNKMCQSNAYIKNRENSENEELLTKAQLFELIETAKIKQPIPCRYPD